MKKLFAVLLLLLIGMAAHAAEVYVVKGKAQWQRKESRVALSGTVCQGRYRYWRLGNVFK